MNSRVIKPHTPKRLIITAVLLGVVLLGFLILAILQSGTVIRDARMTGTITNKVFIPSPAPEFQVTLGREGLVDARQVDGEYILTVEVPQGDGTRRPFKVWLDKERFESLNVGDRFDVGPYLVR